MDNTPQSCQDTSDSGYHFDASCSFFGSTPNTENESTPLSFAVSRKRKASYLSNYSGRKLADVIESYPSTPKFSSTFNESLVNNLEKFHIQPEVGPDEEDKGLLSNLVQESIKRECKIFKSKETNKKFRSAPSTPEKQVKHAREGVKKAKTNSFIKNYPLQSPLNKEAYGILYPDLPSLEPSRKPLTPQKFKGSLSKNVSLVKKCLFTPPEVPPFESVFTNNVLVGNIYKYLSDGDLYRLSKVSKLLKESLLLDRKAKDRYIKASALHKTSKENYRITPPNSPEYDDSFVNTSPGSKNFYYFYNIASELNKNQSVIKCPQCGKASIVENSVGQCQDVNSCGYIFCQKCNSFAYNPKDFKDMCRNVQLLNFKSRNHLGDLSNNNMTTSDYFTDSSSAVFSSHFLNSSASNKYESSGFFSECDNTPVRNVKRNLSQSFSAPSEVKPKAFSTSNTRVTEHPKKYQRRTSLLPVVQFEDTPKPVEVIEPSSPPKVKTYSACSRQSKRNLKRLTR